METSTPILTEVEAIFLADGPIARSTVEEWMWSEDLEVLGIVSTLLHDRAQYERLTSPFSTEEYQAFLRRYVERCIEEDPHGEWADSNFDAGYLLLGWFRRLWANCGFDDRSVVENKEWLARFYREGDDVRRLVLVQATLEHLFEDPVIAAYFSDWQRDPILTEAYADAMLWATGAREQAR